MKLSIPFDFISASSCMRWILGFGLLIVSQTFWDTVHAPIYFSLCVSVCIMFSILSPFLKFVFLDNGFQCGFIWLTNYLILGISGIFVCFFVFLFQSFYFLLNFFFVFWTFTLMTFFLWKLSYWSSEYISLFYASVCLTLLYDDLFFLECKTWWLERWLSG